MGCIVSKKRASDPAAAEENPADLAAQRAAAAVESGWPPWLVAAAGDALQGWKPRRADSFIKIGKIGSGTYSNVYKAREVGTERAVALKKVRVDADSGEEGARFLAREIMALRRVGAHQNIVRLEGLAMSRAAERALYLVFEYLDHDLAGLANANAKANASSANGDAGNLLNAPLNAPNAGFSEAQVKCFMKQLLTGLEHCHSCGVLHRDIKGANLLISDDGVLKIGDFGLASPFDPKSKQVMTSQVVTLWYRAPELLLGVSQYGVGVDLWSAGCILAELFTGKPILPGRTEVEQLHKIFKLCGSPPEKYWKKNKFPHASIMKPRQPYESCIAETFKDYSPSAVSLIQKLLAIDPLERGTATDALNSEFFRTEPLACDPSSLPKYPPSKELDARLQDEKARRQRCKNTRETAAEAARRVHPSHRRSRAAPAPMANAELRSNLNRWRAVAPVNGVSKSEKFPPPHQDGEAPTSRAQDGPHSFVTADTLFASSSFDREG